MAARIPNASHVQNHFRAMDILVSEDWSGVHIKNAGTTHVMVGAPSDCKLLAPGEQILTSGMDFPELTRLAQ